MKLTPLILVGGAVVVYFITRNRKPGSTKTAAPAKRKIATFRAPSETPTSQQSASPAQYSEAQVEADRGTLQAQKATRGRSQPPGKPGYNQA